MSPRHTLLATLKKLAEEVPPRKYFVTRGPVNWLTFDFARHACGIAVRFEDGQLLRSADRVGIPAVLALDLVTTLPDDATEPGIDDTVLDRMIDDAEAIIRGLTASSDTNGDPVIFGVKPSSTRIVEFYDLNLGVQGVIATFEVSY